MSKTETIAHRLDAVRGRISQAERDHHRTPNSVQLLAISKTRPISDIEAAIAQGQRCFGENYLQDALPKITALGGHDIQWHFIGPVQSNKTQAIAQHFHWVHTLDREKIARRLSAQRPSNLPPLNVCIQVNVSQDAIKAGTTIEAAPALARTILTLPRLRLRGLMTVPKQEDDPHNQRQAFHTLNALYIQLQQEGIPLDTLSMGMSHDLDAAVAEGATMVRIGTAIFGQRQ